MPSRNASNNVCRPDHHVRDSAATACAVSSTRSSIRSAWCKVHGDWDLEVVERVPGMRGFAVLPKRWIVERTFGWLPRNRRMSKDDERKLQSSETLIEVALIRLLLARLGEQTERHPRRHTKRALRNCIIARMQCIPGPAQPRRAAHWRLMVTSWNWPGCLTRQVSLAILRWLYCA